MFTDPMKNLRALGLAENMIVADLGAGTGFYTLLCAKLVPLGKVYAIEAIKDYVTTVTNKAKEARLNNIECFWGDVEKLGGTKIKDSIVDVVIASNIFFQVEEKNKFIEEINRILKPGGRVLLIDWLPESKTVRFNGGKFLPQEKVKEMFAQKGLVFVRDIDTGEHHYGMILKK